MRARRCANANPGVTPTDAVRQNNAGPRGRTTTTTMLAFQDENSVYIMLVSR